ncbi:MAG: hypothetical protein ACE5K7_04315 [Phycisphaerae bacterium]
MSQYVRGLRGPALCGCGVGVIWLCLSGPALAQGGSGASVSVPAARVRRAQHQAMLRNPVSRRRLVCGETRCGSHVLGRYGGVLFGGGLGQRALLVGGRGVLGASHRPFLYSRRFGRRPFARGFFPRRRFGFIYGPTFYYPYIYPGYAYPYLPLGYYRRGDEDDAYRRGYRAGRQDAELERTVSNRRRRLYEVHDRLMSQALRSFSIGDYGTAANQFLAAAEANHADPASRLHAAHALIAVGDYGTAVVVLRRAFELQPRLLSARYDIRDDYGDAADFRQHLAALRQAVEQDRDDADLWLLLGYVRYHSADAEGAYRAFRRAASLNPRDSLARRFLELSRRARRDSR